MNDKPRIYNSIRNGIYSLSGKSIDLIMNFIVRTIFINILGATYLGVNGLFGNILSMLSLAELGVGSAITYSMYKPLAEKDVREIKALMSLYAVAYRIIGCVVAIIGVVLIPFLGSIIKDKPDIPHLNIIYIMYVANSALTYFFSYKRSILIADQREYINSINQYVFRFAQNIAQIIILFTTKNFLLFITLQMLFNFLSNVSISRIADRIYPFLNNNKREHLDKESRRKIFKNIGAMMSHKIGNFVVLGTDNILISVFVGINWVGLYSNYYLIIYAIKSIINLLYNSITASVGSLNVKESRDKSHDVFNRIYFINSWLYGFCSISLLVLFNPVITLWLGSKYIMDNEIVLIIVINFYISGMQIIGLFKTTAGLFWNDRYKPLIESIINLVVSIVLLRRFGIAGVFLGTFVSCMTTNFWIEPYLVYKHAFKKSLIIYFKKYVMYTSATVVAAVATQFSCSMLHTSSLFCVFEKGLLCLIIPNTIFILLFFKTSEFKYFLRLFSKIIVKRSLASTSPN